MKRLIPVFLALPLVACGSGSDDFSVEVAMDSAQVQGRLMSLDGGDMARFAGVASLQPANPEPGVLRFEFPGDDGEPAGQLLLRIEGIEGNRSRVVAALDLDAVQFESAGEDMYVSEARAEDMLERALIAWAEDVSTSGYGSLKGVNDTLAVFSVAVRPERLASLDDPSAFVDRMASQDDDLSGGFSNDADISGGDWASADAEYSEDGGWGDEAFGDK